MHISVISMILKQDFLCPLQVSEREDKLLAEHMAKLQTANEEVDGDVDSEEEEDTGMGEVDVENSGIAE